MNKTKRQIHLDYVKNNPWSKHRAHQRDRCANHPSYNGERRLIKNLMSMQDIKMLWFRDKAYLMDKPSLSRKNPAGNYTVENCCFMELRENQHLPRHMFLPRVTLRTLGKWTKKYDKCIICGTTNYRHRTHGSCQASKCRRGYEVLKDNEDKIIVEIKEK